MSLIHNKTKRICICCNDTTNYIIILHKTRRQTHGLCIDCAEGYINPVLEKMTINIKHNLRVGSLTIKCPGTYTGQRRNQCNHQIDIKKLLVPNGSSIYTNILRISLVLDNPNLFICQNNSCSDIVERFPGLGLSYLMECHSCKTTWCSNCLSQPYHYGLNCVEYNIKTSNDNDSKYLEQLKNDGDLKFCPVCAVSTTKEKNNEGKDVGCNKIVCSSCGTKWCWLCDQTNIDYDHFNSKAKNPCANKLWLGVDVQNQI